MNSKKRIAITGGQGTIGKILFEAFSGEFEMKIIDKKDGYISVFEEIDIASEYDELKKSLEGFSVVLHLAWDFTEDYPNDSIVAENKTMTENVLKASHEAGVKRVILASSVHADSYVGLNLSHGQKTVNETPIPDTPYGASKVYIESLGRYYAKYKDVEVVAIRLGGVNERDEVRYEEDPEYDKVLLYKKDCIDLMRKCIEVDYIPEKYCCLYAISNNAKRVHSIANNIGWKPVFPKSI